MTEDDLEEFRTLCRDFGVPAPENMRAYRQDGITFSGPGTSWTASSGRRIQPYWPPAGGVRADGGATFSFVCTVCGRNPQLRAERLGQALDATYARDPAGRGPWEIDVSWSD